MHSYENISRHLNSASTKFAPDDPWTYVALRLRKASSLQEPAEPDITCFKLALSNNPTTLVSQLELEDLISSSDIVGVEDHMLLQWKYLL
ncbi:hypothetical protein Tco_0667964 [Tanacetum coccineum]